MWQVAGFAMPAARTALATARWSDALVEVVAATLAGGAVVVVPGRREDPLPGPLPAARGYLRVEGVGELDGSRRRSEVGSCCTPHALRWARSGARGLREQRPAVLLPLSVRTVISPALEVEVFHAQAAAFEQAQAGAVHQATP